MLLPLALPRPGGGGRDRGKWMVSWEFELFEKAIATPLKMKSHVVFAEEWASSFDDGACACHLDINTYSSYRTHTRSKRGEVNTRLSFQIDGNGATAAPICTSSSMRRSLFKTGLIDLRTESDSKGRLVQKPSLSAFRIVLIHLSQLQTHGASHFARFTLFWYCKAKMCLLWHSFRQDFNSKTSTGSLFPNIMVSLETTSVFF